MKPLATVRAASILFRVVASLAVLSVAAVTVPGCESKITQANFDRIKPGMTQDEVQTILGKGEDETPEGVSVNYAGVGSADKGKLTVIAYKDGRKRITVTYNKDGKVQDIVPTGL